VKSVKIDFLEEKMIQPCDIMDANHATATATATATTGYQPPEKCWAPARPARQSRRLNNVGPDVRRRIMFPNLNQPEK